VADVGLDEVFGRERPRLVGLAYRITGSRLDAEDIVQEAWVRAQGADWASIERPPAWLTTVVSRLALDELRSARRRRETYVGPWLPEPIRTGGPGATTGPPGSAADPRQPRRAGAADGGAESDPAVLVELAESLTYGFLRLLEALDPVERVVFLLADVFDTPYDEIAAAVGRTPAACRQVASRARRRVKAGRVRRDPPEDAERVAHELLRAVTAGDVDHVLSLLAEDVVVVSDGGANVRAARRPVVGRQRVARFLVNITHQHGVTGVEVATINGEPGVVMSVDDGQGLVVVVEVVDGRAHAIHAIRNPDKLAALDVVTPLA